MVGVNRVGVDGEGVAYAGDSVAIDFLGEPLADLGAAAQVTTVSLDGRGAAEVSQQIPRAPRR